MVAGAPPGRAPAFCLFGVSGPACDLWRNGSNDSLGNLMSVAGGGGGRMQTEGNSLVTFRAPARLRLADGKLSDLRRTSAALVKYMAAGSEVPYHVLRWYDTAWSD